MSPNEFNTGSPAVYLKEIGLTPLLRRDDAMELARKIQAQGPDAELAKHLLVKANLRLVVSMAKQKLGKGLSLQDLIQEGNVGLILAAERFDPTRGIAFSTYARHWINREIMEALRIARPLRISKYEMTHVCKVWSAIKKWRTDKNQEPTEVELREALAGERIPPDLFELALRTEQCIPLQTPLHEGGSMTLADVLADGSESPELAAHRNSIQGAVRKALARLPEKKGKIIELYYGFDTGAPDGTPTDEAVGRQLGMCRANAQKSRATAERNLSGILGKSVAKYEF